MLESLVEDWQSARAALRAIEESEHPDITDAYGRVWVWKGRDLYTHDGCLSFPRDMIDDLRLPSYVLAGNPNYKLCDICTGDWPNA